MKGFSMPFGARVPLESSGAKMSGLLEDNQEAGGTGNRASEVRLPVLDLISVWEPGDGSGREKTRPWSVSVLTYCHRSSSDLPSLLCPLPFLRFSPSAWPRHHGLARSRKFSS